ncbi:MAG: ArnT family glycosyltransferase [Actinomycetota bacterium]
MKRSSRKLTGLPLLAWVLSGVTVILSLLAGRIERFTPGYFDEGIYRNLAHNLIVRHFYAYSPGFNVATRPPGYPFFLAGIRSIVDAQWAVRIVQAFLAGATVLIAAWIAAQLYDKVVAIVVSALLVATGTLAAYSSFELSETLATFLLVLAIAVLLFARDRSSQLWIGISGFVLGLSILVRPQSLGIIPFLVVWLALALPKRKLVGASLLVITALLAITPWTIRNYVRLHALVPVSTYGGVNFWMVNNPRATGRFPGSVSLMIDPVDYARITALPEAAQDREWYRMGFSYIKSHPFQSLKNWFRDLAIYVGSRDHYPGNRLVLRDRVKIPWLDDRLLWVFAPIAGFVALRRKDWRMLLPAFVVTPLVLFFMIALPLSRYRHGVQPFLAMYCAATLVMIARALRKKRHRSQADVLSQEGRSGS